jgi:CubicO group peptidase (beta-lactamase class C family)
MTVRPEDVGLSSERLARIDVHLRRRYVDPGKIPGALTVVARHGKVAFRSAIGLRDREREQPMTEDTIFRIYSMTKPITSVAVMMLSEHGHFQLDDPVHRFLPELRGLRVYQAGSWPRFVTTRCERPMTVRDLLRHTSGLTYGFMERTNVDAAYRALGLGGEKRFDGTLQEFTEKLAQLPLEFSPGSAWNYSVSTDVLGRIVEVISGRPFGAYLREEIFEPLGMVDTGFCVPPEQAERLAACYGRTFSKKTVLNDDPATSPYLEPAKFESGGGGLVSTAADYLRFCEMLRCRGELDGVHIIGGRTLDYMTRNHLPGGADLAELSTGLFSEVAYEGQGFGLGFSTILDPVASPQIGSVGEFAWGGAASTIFWVDPAEDLVVLFLTQLMPSQTFNFRGQLKQIVYGAIVE